MAAPRRVIALVSDAAQRQHLQEVSRSRTEPASRVERARIILTYLAEPSAYAAARTVGVTQQTVTRCLERAAELGVIEALDDRPRAGRDPVITLEAKTWLVALACQKPKELGYPHELWTTRLLAAHARDRGTAAGHSSLAKLAQGTVCKILAEHAVKPHRVRYYLEKRDPEFEPKMTEILCVYRQVAVLREHRQSAASAGEGMDGGPCHHLLRREARHPGDRHDRAGSSAAARPQPDRDARSRVQASWHRDPDGRHRSAERSRPRPGQGTPSQSRVHRVSQAPRRRLSGRYRNRDHPRQPFGARLARDHSVACGAAPGPLCLHHLVPGRLVDSLDRTTYFTLSTRTSSSLRDMIPEIDIWRAANLMLKRYGDAALVESRRARGRW
jgi:transposase